MSKKKSTKKKFKPRRNRRSTPNTAIIGVGKNENTHANIARGLGLPSYFANQLSLNSLDAVADALGVSVSKVNCWRESSKQKELNSGCPYNLGRIVLELLGEGHLTRSRIDQLPETAKRGLLAHFATTAYSNSIKGKIEEILPAILERLNEECLAHGITDEDWKELESLACKNGFTEDWFVKHENDEEAQDTGYLQCISQLPAEKRAKFEAFVAGQELMPPAVQQSRMHKNRSATIVQAQERFGIAVGFPKTASLFLDKVWSLDAEMPREFQLRLGTPTEGICRELNNTMVRETADACRATSMLPIALAKARELDIEIAPGIESMICEEFKKLTGYRLPAFLGTRAAFDKVYETGDCEVLSAAIVSIPIVDESKLKWEQIREIRADKDSILKLRRFFSWVDRELIGKKASVITDTLSVNQDFEQVRGGQKIQRNSIHTRDK